MPGQLVDGQQLEGSLPHLHARDATLLLVSRAPLAKLQAYKQRLGWSIPWVSAANTDFNFDLGASYTEEQLRTSMPSPERAAADRASERGRVRDRPPRIFSEAPVMSAFALEDGAVYHTYSTTWRGLEFLMGYYPILDRAPKGRDEGEVTWQTWIRRHDEYA